MVSTSKSSLVHGVAQAHEPAKNAPTTPSKACGGPALITKITRISRTDDLCLRIGSSSPPPNRANIEKKQQRKQIESRGVQRTNAGYQRSTAFTNRQFASPNKF